MRTSAGGTYDVARAGTQVPAEPLPSEVSPNRVPHSAHPADKPLTVADHGYHTLILTLGAPDSSPGFHASGAN
ncbi:MAG: hypothetical protein Rhob2KO_12270 [Rhodopirellula baltica]